MLLYLFIITFPFDEIEPYSDITASDHCQYLALIQSIIFLYEK